MLALYMYGVLPIVTIAFLLKGFVPVWIFFAPIFLGLFMYVVELYGNHLESKL